MRKLVWDSSFRRAFKAQTHSNKKLQLRILAVLELLVDNPFHPQLKTHKLKGRLDGLWASWVEYDCRIIFLFDADPDSGEDAIVLVDLGSHDEVY